MDGAVSVSSTAVWPQPARIAATTPIAPPNTRRFIIMPLYSLLSFEEVVFRGYGLAVLLGRAETLLDFLIQESDGRALIPTFL